MGLRVGCRTAVGGRRGFTLVELLVVIAIIGVLIAILLPAIQAARESSLKSSCSGRMRQLGLGVQSFVSAHGRYPNQGFDPVAGVRSNQGTSALAMILPYVEENRRYDAWMSAGTDPNSGGIVKAFTCPADEAQSKQANVAYTNYGVVVTNITSRVQNGSTNTYTGVFVQNKGGRDFVYPLRVSHGLSKTAMFAEYVLGQQFSPWRFRSRQLNVTGSGTRAQCNAFNAALSDHSASNQPGSTFSDTGKTNISFAYRPNAAHCSQRDGVTYDNASASSMHRGGVNVAMADASVTFVALDINAGAVGGNPDSVVVATASAGNPKGVWGAMATRDGTDFQ